MQKYIAFSLTEQFKFAILKSMTQFEIALLKGGNNKLTKYRTWFKSVRENQDITQENLARKLGVTRQHIGLIENGVTNPSPELAKKIGEILEIDWTKFFESEEEARGEGCGV